MTPLFALSRIVATPGALAALERSGETPATFLRRHVCGDWGELSAHDRTENEESLEQGFRLLSSYRLTDSTKYGSSPRLIARQPVFCFLKNTEPHWRAAQYNSGGAGGT